MEPPHQLERDFTNSQRNNNSDSCTAKNMDNRYYEFTSSIDKVDIENSQDSFSEIKSRNKRVYDEELGFSKI